ncbi:MAG: lamin tail domain-containing protein, partial [candidate division KSB1 bacterium]|nr:lamin tail domain-containing protein [candidate division KSB1 bacterium]
ILISEVQVAGADAGDEFIELYNPTDWEVNISNWSIQYLSGAATSTAQAVKKNFESGSVIGARSYFLIARGLNASGTDGYTGSRRQDLSHRTFSLSGVANGATIFLARNQEIISGADDPDIVDRLAYGSGDGLVAESAAAPLPAAGQSLERKAWISGACVSASGENEFSGNGCDTDNNANDFEIRSTPYPQNLANLPETRSAPQILNLSATYSSSMMNADFSWTLSADARGATSTNIYTISKLTSTSTVQLFRASSTVSFATPVSEDTTFEFRVEDEEGFFRNTTTTVTSPFYSYRGAIFEQSLDTEALVAPPRGGAWFAQVFTPQRTGRVTSISFDLRSGIGNLDGANFCSLRLYQAASPLATSTANLIGSAYLLPWTSPPEESMSGPPCAANNFSFPTSTIYAGTTYTLVFSYSEFNRDFDIRGAGDVIPGSYWMGGIFGPFIEQASKDIKFSLSGIVMSDVLFTEPPSQPQNLQINFDRFNSELDLSWDAATDSDSGFHYQINYTTSTTLSADGWRSVGTSTTASIPLVYPNAYKIGVRARDDFYNVSTSTVSEWRFPDDFRAVDSLVSQLDTNQGIIEGFGQGIGTTVEYGQTFTVATTSVPYSIRLNTEGTAGGSCWVKIYAAESIASADFQNPVATTGILGGGGSNACDASPSKTFYFSSTGVLNPGANYIWIYTIQDGNGAFNGIVGGYNPAGYPGTFSSRVTTSFIHYLAKPREYNAYFELFGDLQ